MIVIFSVLSGRFVVRKKRASRTKRSCSTCIPIARFARDFRVVLGAKYAAASKGVARKMDFEKLILINKFDFNLDSFEGCGQTIWSVLNADLSDSIRPL